MKDREQLLQKAKKIQALAERGDRGEKESAAALLDRLMKQYGITETELAEDRREMAWFRFKTPLERRLLHQIIYAVTGRVGYSCVGARTNRPRKMLGIECTAAERLEIELSFEFYNAALEKELDRFYSAFLNKNHIFPEKAIEEVPDVGEIDLEEAQRLSMMMAGMEEYTRRKALGSGTKERGKSIMPVTWEKKYLARRYQNAVNNAQGHFFEDAIKAGCALYSRQGRAEIDKTPEPFRVMEKSGGGIFKGRFTAPAQPDFQGTLDGGRSIVFEAKYTTTDRLKWDVLTGKQQDTLERHAARGAVAAVCAGIGNNFFFVPWAVWRDMKEHFGRKYVTAANLEPFRVRFNGAVLFLDYKDGSGLLRFCRTGEEFIDEFLKTEVKGP